MNLLKERQIDYADKHLVECIQNNIDYVLQTWIKKINAKKDDLVLGEKVKLIEETLKAIPDYYCHNNEKIDFNFLATLF